MIAAAVAGSLVVFSMPAQAQTAVGTLRCTVAGGVGLILGSSRRVTCVFRPSDGSFVENYSGRVGRIGVDIGVSGRSLILWKVIAPTSALDRRGALEGRFSGVTAGASIGVGAGANVLVGGNANTFTLQPLSINAKTGINLAAGIGSMSLSLDD